MITGAAGGLGSEFARTLAELGADLYLVDRDEAQLENLKNSIADMCDVKVKLIVCDLESEVERSALIGNLNSELTKLDALVNNAAFVGTSGLQGWAVDFQHQSLDSWRRALEVNLTSVFHLSQGLAHLLGKAEIGTIVNIGSIYAKFGPDWGLYSGTSMSNPAAYAASKGGLLQLTRWLSTTLAPKIRVNSISPGGIYRGQPEAFVERYEAKVPLRRMARESDFAGIIAFLVSDSSSYITGQDFAVDGGWGAW